MSVRFKSSLQDALLRPRLGLRCGSVAVEESPAACSDHVMALEPQIKKFAATMDFFSWIPGNNA